MSSAYALLSLTALGDLVASLIRHVTNLPSFYEFLVLALTALVTAAVVERVTYHLGVHLLPYLGDPDDVVSDHIHTPLYATVAVWGLYASTAPLNLAPGTHKTLRNIALTILVVMWVVALLRAGRRIADASSSTRYLDREFKPIFENLWTFTLILVGTFSVLAVWGINITPFLASAGLLGVAAGFAARDTIANFFGGVMLYLDDTYKLGDFVQLEGGLSGTVRDVSVRSTVLQTREGNLVTVPNSQLNSARIVNESAPQTMRRVDTTVGVAYGSDLEKVRDVLTRVAEDASLTENAPSPEVHLVEFGNSSVQLELRAWVSTPHDVPRAIDEMNTGIYERFTEEGIEIPFPQRTVRYASNDTDDEPTSE